MNKKKDPNRYPKGWNRKRVQALIDHYDNQTDEEASAEDEAAYRDSKFTIMAVPMELVQAVRRLIARYRGGATRLIALADSAAERRQKVARRRKPRV